MGPSSSPRRRAGPTAPPSVRSTAPPTAPPSARPSVPAAWSSSARPSPAAAIAPRLLPALALALLVPALAGCGSVWLGDPTAWPPGFRAVGAKEIACGEAADAARSAAAATPAGAAPATLTLANRSGVWLALAAVDGTGATVQTGLLAPWETARRRTRVGIPWRIEEPAGRCLAVMVPVQGSATIRALPP
jgi:hypothetical protein